MSSKSSSLTKSSPSLSLRFRLLPFTPTRDAVGFSRALPDELSLCTERRMGVVGAVGLLESDDVRLRMEELD